MESDYEFNITRVLISYHRADFQWAKWIAWELEKAFFSVEVQEARYQSDFLAKLQQAAYPIILVLSPEYVDLFDQQWQLTGILRQAGSWHEHYILPLMVRDCGQRLPDSDAFIVTFIQIEDETVARNGLLMNLQLIVGPHEFLHTSSRAAHHVTTKRPRFPGDTFISSHIPRRNLFFTGREDILECLYRTLIRQAEAMLPHVQILSGLGGIGKTQIAIEYIYRYAREYKAILWARAASQKTLSEDFLSIAEQLDLIEDNQDHHNYNVAAVKTWLQEHGDWLLILDDVEDMSAISDFIGAGRGHVLITTRLHILDQSAYTIEIEKMTPEDSTLLLLRRTRLLAPNASIDTVSGIDYEAARAISEIMDGLPLALDQAGAYVDETGCGLLGYLERFQRQQVALLKRRSGLPSDHAETVATSWSLSFEKIQQANPTATNILRFCAFLHPDAIPGEILLEGLCLLDPTFDHDVMPAAVLDAAIMELSRFSLVRLNPDIQLLSIHPIVQFVLRDAIDEETQRLWAERTVRAISRAFPEVEFSNWHRCQRCLPHVQVCVTLIKKWHLLFPEAAHLLHKAAYYLWQRAEYETAENFYIQAWKIEEELYGSEHEDIASVFHNLALLYKDQGKYPETEELFTKALDIRETLDPESRDVGASLTGLGWTYRTQGKYALARELLEKALHIREKAPGPESSDYAQTLNKLAWVYYDLGQYAESESLHLKALAIRENALGPKHPSVAQNLNNLAWLYDAQGRYAEAEKLYRRTLNIRQQALNPDHPDTAQTLNNLALLCYHQGRYAEAESYYNEALRIRKQILRDRHTYTAQTMGDLALLYHAQGKYDLAEAYYKESLTIRENALGKEHPEIAICLNNLAELYVALSRFEEAETLFEDALKIREAALGSQHPHMAQTLNSLAELYIAHDRLEEAEPLLQRALAIRKEALPGRHPYMAQTLNSLARLYAAQGRHELAESFFQRVLTMRKEVLGSQHPHMAQTLSSLAELYVTLGKYEQAEKLYREVMIIDKNVLGPDHPHLISILKNYAGLLRTMHRDVEAFHIDAHLRQIQEKYGQEQ